MRWITWAVAARGGLVRIRDHEALPQVLPMLAELAMVELYAFSATLVDQVLQHAKTHKWLSR